MEMVDLKGRRVLVTGAGGFIGSHLVESLLDLGARVRAFVHYDSRGAWGHLDHSAIARDSTQLEVIAGDIRDPFFVRDAVADCDTVFHLAALIAIPFSYIAPQSYVGTNVTGTLNVLEACRSAGVRRLVHTSTSETYGTARYTPIDEAHPLQGQSPYSATKIAADKLAESFACSYELPVVTIRPFNTFGPRQSARAVIPAVISQLAAGKRELALGSLAPIRDFTFVKDTVAGFIAMARAPIAPGELVNIGSGAGVTIGELVALIQQLMGTNVTVGEDEMRTRPANSEVMQLLCGNSKAADLLGWRPQYTLIDGLKETIAYVTGNLHQYRTDINNI